MLCNQSHNQNNFHIKQKCFVRLFNEQKGFFCNKKGIVEKIRKML